MNSLLITFLAASLFAGDGQDAVPPERHGPGSAQEHGPESAQEHGSESGEEHGAESGGEGGEAGEPGTLYGITETARQSRRGVDLVIRYDEAAARFAGTVTNTTGAPVADVRVEIHLSNGVELGPTPLLTLKPDQRSQVVLDARGQDFAAWQVHIEIGRGEH